MDSYAVIGNPIDHSKSPEIHEQFAKQCQQDMEYSTLLSTEENFNKDVTQFFENGSGLNVTLPFKVDAMHFSDELSERAKQAGAVNTLIKQQGKIIGDNTDGHGLIRDLVHNQQQNLKQKTILLLGAGGASRGVIAPLLAELPNKIIIANRTVSKAEALVDMFIDQGVHRDQLEAISLKNIVNITKLDVLINASSAGLQGEAPELPEAVETCFCYDMVYKKDNTAFIQAAKAHGCTHYADGLGMLVEQAAESFYLWRKVRPDTQPVLQALRAAL